MLRSSLILILAQLLVAPCLPAQERSREADLAAIRREITRLQEDLERIDRRADDLTVELKRTDLELELQRKRVAESQAAHELAAVRVDASVARVSELSERLAIVEAELKKRLVMLYSLGRQGYLRLFLSIEPNADLFAAVRQLRFLVRRDAVALEQYREAKQELAQERDRLIHQQGEVRRWLEAEEERRLALVNLRHRQERLLVRVDVERQALETRTTELVAKERRLAHFLDLLYGRADTPLAGTPMADFRGVLDWPVQGTVEVGFGPRRDPRYNTAVPHNGIEVALNESSQVRVVYPGKVLFAAPFEGYGPTVVVHHSGKVFTLYAGLFELQVEAGDVVSLGEAIGVADDRLYFEVRFRNEPQDPVTWLR